MIKQGILLLVMVGLAYGKTFYEERQREKKQIFYLEEENHQSGIRIVAKSSGETHVFWLDKGYATQKWFFTNKDVQFAIEREGNVLVRKEHGVIITNYIIDKAPWYQFVEVSFRPWILSKEKKKDLFWIIQPGIMALHRMVATKEGEETLEIDGKRISTIKVRMTLPGAMAAFWGSWYWCDQNGVFLRYEGVRVMGQPEIIVQRIFP
ncbi:MAG: hypothetical protein ACK4TN_01175 [Brevinematales bacterium]